MWYCQYCPSCEVVTPLPVPRPRVCDNVLCRRRTYDRPDLVRGVYISDWPVLLADEPCHVTCLSEQCGLLVRFVFCGDLGAKRYDCLIPRKKDEDTESEDDDENHPTSAAAVSV